MSERLIRAVLVCALSASGLIGSQAPASAYALGTRWRTTPLAPADCLQRASSLLKERGFDVTNVGNDVATGLRNDYTGQVMCPSGRGIAVFIFVGSESEQVTNLLNDFAANF